jgi:hypothetical protein
MAFPPLEPQSPIPPPPGVDPHEAPMPDRNSFWLPPDIVPRTPSPDDDPFLDEDEPEPDDLPLPD